MNVIKISALSLAGLLATTVHADPKLTVSGNLAEYYQLNLNDNVTPNVAGNKSNGVANRAFDTKSNEFAFQGGEVNFSSIDDATKTSAFVNLLVGPKADLINANVVAPATNTSSFFVGQAYVTKTWADAKVTFGKFPTFIGTEVEATTGNGNFSRGLVYGMEPVYNVGLKVDYSLPAAFTLTGQFDNGNSVDDAANEGKGYGLALAYAGIKNVGLTLSWAAEPGAKNAGGGIPYTDFVNVLASFQAMDSLGFNAEYLYKTVLSTDGGVTPSTKQHGIALYANWATPVKGLSLIPRFEQLMSPDATGGTTITPATLAVATAPQAQDSYTVTLKYVDGPLTHFLEYRLDASSEYQYSGPKPTQQSDASQIAQTVTYAAAFSF